MLLLCLLVQMVEKTRYVSELESTWGFNTSRLLILNTGNRQRVHGRVVEEVGFVGIENKPFERTLGVCSALDGYGYGYV